MSLIGGLDGVEVVEGTVNLSGDGTGGGDGAAVGGGLVAGAFERRLRLPVCIFENRLLGFCVSEMIVNTLMQGCW